MDKQSDRPVILVVGTRPEGIKMMPVLFELKRAGIPVLLCSTAQHGHLLDQVFDLFGVKPDINLQVMKPGQDLFYLTTTIVHRLKTIFTTHAPSLVLVQGDTTTAFAASLAAFYLAIPVGHIEAGLRTGDIQSPFPEEFNRRAIALMARYHFAPTAQAAAHLLAECVARESVYCTGNTVVDALRIVKEKITQGSLSLNQSVQQYFAQARAFRKKTVLLTAHRRESFDGGIVRILETIKEFLSQHSDVWCIYPYHPNPAVVAAIGSSGIDRLASVFCCEPLAYHDLVYTLGEIDLVVTDSGGIQEEAVSLGKQVVVLREKSERMEGVDAGLSHLVGTDTVRIKEALAYGLGNRQQSNNHCVYGDGYAAQKIVAVIAQQQKEIQSRQKKQVAYKKEEVMKKICMVGLGYIGLPTAIVLADAGFQVVGVDIDAQRVARLAAGDPVIQEPLIVDKLRNALRTGNFVPTTAVGKADYFLIAVPTPFKDGHKADLSYVFNAAESLVPVLKQGDVVIIESTIPVGTTQEVADYLQYKTGLKAGHDFYVAHCPERVLPGNIFHELVANARIIGGINKESVEQAKQVYKAFVTGELYLTDAATAEMVKLVENSSRDVQIAFANQVASMAQAVGLDPYEVIELANKHPRVKILHPSCGVGGHCIAVDPWFLVEGFPAQTQLLKAAREVNDAKPYEVIARIHNAVAQWSTHTNKRCRVLLYGATYKADVDDIRESPALKIAVELAMWQHIDLIVCEPHVEPALIDSRVAKVGVAHQQYDAQQADIIVYLVAHSVFRTHDHALLKSSVIIDACGILHTPKSLDHHNEYQFWPARIEAKGSLPECHTSNQPITKECA